KYERSTPDHGDEVLRSVDTIEARSLSFAYDSGSERLVLDDVSFAIAHGDALGIVGPSGSGKTTLIQIILRLRTPDRGELLVNGAEARRFSASSWTERVSFVPQDNHLLRGTVAENIAFFRDLDAATIERAARRAHLHEDVLKLPNGYDSLIGPGHADLSGGQRQRLGLARALACDPDLLVLDEPTSALDMRSESLIQETLDELAAEVTMVIVAHRMSTLARCSHILVLQDGRATAFGTPEEVSASSAFYREAIAMTSSGTMADRSPAPSPRAARRGAPLRPSSP
ncbi:MAG TPA: ABC transporter ATP-binding protein, partial [Acidimicrobiales bacterium]|nr:ABC transporter ATP-binding protein [Acidimicrobiales bacterium]